MYSRSTGSVRRQEKFTRLQICLITRKTCLSNKNLYNTEREGQTAVLTNLVTRAILSYVMEIQTGDVLLLVVVSGGESD